MNNIATLTDMERKALDEMKRLTARESLSIKVNSKKIPTLTDSKFGGYPYWDMNKEYPIDKRGHKLMLLAQFNLDELNAEGKNPGGLLPKTGMLQFFIGNDDLLGMDCDFTKDSEGRLEQDCFRVVYHRTIDNNITIEQVKAMGMPVCTEVDSDETPITKEYGLDITVDTSYMGTDDYRFNVTFQQAAANIGWTEAMKAGTYYNQFSSKARDVLMDELSNDGHKMLGYPFFTQYDPREVSDYDYKNDGLSEEEIQDYEAKLLKKKYDIQLFQMDSDYDNDSKEDYVLWGDCGVANFFINEDNLKNEDFGDILYSWDCC